MENLFDTPIKKIIIIISIVAVVIIIVYFIFFTNKETQSIKPQIIQQLKKISSTNDPDGIKNGKYREVPNSQLFGSNSNNNWNISIKFNLEKFNNTLQCIIGKMQDNNSSKIQNNNSVNNWGLWITPQRKLQWRIGSSSWDLNNFGELKDNTLYEISITYNEAYNFLLKDLSYNKPEEYFNNVEYLPIIINAPPINTNSGSVTFGGDFPKSNMNSRFLGSINEITSSEIITTLIKTSEQIISSSTPIPTTFTSTSSPTTFTSTSSPTTFTSTSTPAPTTTIIKSWKKLGLDIIGKNERVQCGKSVSLSGNGSVVAVGMPGNSLTFVYRLLDNNWVQLGGVITGDSGGQNGYSVSLSEDGTRVAVGGWITSNLKGITRVYELRNDSEWVQLGQNIYGITNNDFSGYSVSISADGSKIAVGSPGGLNGNGLTRMYQLSNDKWVQIGGDINGKTIGEFSGASVSLSSDGSIVAIGAPLNDNERGITSVYKLIDNIWTQIGRDIIGLIAEEQSGYNVSISGNGLRVAIGAPKNSNERGVSRIYQLLGNSWTQLGGNISGRVDGERSGEYLSISSDGSKVAIGAPNINSNTGVTRVYELSGNIWTQFGNDIYGEVIGEFSGSSVSLSSNGFRIGIGAPSNSMNKGITRVYNI